MGVSMAAFTTFIEQFSDVLWNSLLLFLLVGTGVYFTVRLRGVQVRRFGEGFRRVFGGFTLRGKKADAEGMSSFQALTTAIAAQVGTGNITGCATALVSGGPGALFWTWVSAFFGMATIYAEAVLAQHYKTTVNGHVTGGPAYYIRAAFKGKIGKVLATVFSVLIILALGFMGNMVQSNSIGDAFHNAFGLNRLAVGVVVAAIAAFIFLGGVQRIAAVTEKVVPIMAAFYILGCIVILVINAKALPGALAQVFVLAFEPQAMAGGIAGVTVQQSMRFGVARGLFSNEAGLGSTPHAHALAKVERPQDQGAVAILGVFVDTFVVLTLTGLVLITSGLIPQGMTGTSLTQAAFSQAFGGFGPIFIAVCMFFFAFSTIIGWYFFGQSNFKALFGEKLLPVYSIIVVAFILVGSTLKVDLVWALADLFNGLMAVPNLLALLADFPGDMVLVTHSRDEAYHMCGQIALMDAGRVLAHGPTKQVFADPRTVQGGRLTGCKNIFPARKVDDHTIFVPDWGVDLHPARMVEDGLVAMGVRAHSFRPEEERNPLAVHCVGKMEEPFEWIIRMRAEGQTAGSPDLWWRVSKEIVPETMPTRLGVAPEQVLLFYE